MPGPGLGAELGHYRLQQKIGAGGMGEVFLARDTHLGRDVAIKLLPPHRFAEESANKRFRKEATALSRISHPNVASVFDFDTQDGTDFLVMEYIPGVSLDQMLSAALPEKEVLALGTQLAEGLSAAHEQGVVHRDLKPGNVRVTADGRAKILDFGLAKLRRAAADDVTESLTETHAVCGTLPYMPPEQLRGAPADVRGDIYSLGVILFEMATGKLPFQEKLSTALTDSILHTPCPPPSRLRLDLSPRLEEVILKCLEKDPANRYHSAKDLLVDLRRATVPNVMRAASEPRFRRVLVPALAAAAIILLVALAIIFDLGGLRHRFSGNSTHTIESIAVLPLANLSGDPRQEYFVDGMTDELITQLRKIESLRVISRTSVMRFKNSSTPLPEIARQLKVDAVIEGSVMRSGDRIRINAQLLSAADTHIWADSFDRDLRDVLALSSEVTRAIADQVRVKLTALEREQLQQSRPVVKEAYEAYLQGQFFSQRSEYTKAAEYFEVAVQNDAQFVPAWYNLGEAYSMLSFVRGIRRANPSGGAHEKVMQLAPESAEAYILRGDEHFYRDWDWEACERDFRHAVDLAPRHVEALGHYGLCLSALGRHDAALSVLERAKEVDPLSPNLYRRIGDVFDRAHRPEQAIAHYRKAIELDPQNAAWHLMLARAYAELGKLAEAREAYLQALRLGKYAPAETRTLETVLNTHGVAAFLSRHAQIELHELQAQGLTPQMAPSRFAALYAALGQKERALRYLEQAYAARMPQLAWLKTDREWDPLRSDPRFLDILRRMKYPD